MMMVMVMVVVTMTMMMMIKIICVAGAGEKWSSSWRGVREEEIFLSSSHVSSLVHTALPSSRPISLSSACFAGYAKKKNTKIYQRFSEGITELNYLLLTKGLGFSEQLQWLKRHQKT